MNEDHDSFYFECFKWVTNYWNWENLLDYEVIWAMKKKDCVSGIQKSFKSFYFYGIYYILIKRVDIDLIFL